VASYSLFIKPSAAKEIETLPKQDRRKVVSRIEALATNPRPPGCEKLSGQEQYRIRQGKYRILYTIDDKQVVVVVVRVGHRKVVYR
jgi:mRNA interferase RelE/StbE